MPESTHDLLEAIAAFVYEFFGIEIGPHPHV